MTVIPVANPGAGYRALKAEIDAAAIRALESGWYVMGTEVAAFEREFAEWVGTAECVTVGSGTDALVLILRAMGIGPGHAVLTVSHTAVATVTAIDLVGARPVLVDVDPDRFTMSPDHLERSISGWKGEPIMAIVPVHLYGHPAEMDEILAIGARHQIPVIEDCAQAHGATYNGRAVGTMGVAGAFSFYPTKNLGAMGDGGAVTTSDAGVAERCRLQKQYGWRERYISLTNGMNTRLDELQAAILRVKLKSVHKQNLRRREIAQTYAFAGRNTRIRHPSTASGVQHAFHQYVVMSDDRPALQAHLEANGVGSAILYPMPVHLQPGYERRVAVGAGGLPATEALCKRILSVPVYPELTGEECERVRGALKTFAPAGRT